MEEEFEHRQTGFNEGKGREREEGNKSCSYLHRFTDTDAEYDQKRRFPGIA